MSTQIKNNETRKKARRRLKPEVKVFFTFVLFLITLSVVVNLFYGQSETTREEPETQSTSEFSTEVKQSYVETIKMTIKEAPTVENVEEVIGVIPFGVFYITGYTPTCEHCCGKSDGITASGVVASAERTVAMHQTDMNNLGIEYGDSIYIEGIGERVVEDTGCRQGVIDVACASHEDCYKITRYATVEVLGK
jgi:3D (Asp-Asp-Asp) domain-containing protein